MSYIGNTQNNQNYVPAVDFFSGNGSTTAFTLSRPVASVAAVQAVINNVPQNPGDAFTVSGSTITFTSAPPSGTNNIYVYYTSPNTQVVQPGQGTVGTNELANGGVTSAKLASTTGTGAVALASLPSFTTTMGVGGATPAASGSGITFPATQSASSDANTLDDYEEGTWTPTAVAGVSGFTVDTGNCKYTKVGRVVNCIMEIYNFTGQAGATLVVGGLPFASDPAIESSFVFMANQITFSGYLTGYIGTNSTRMSFYYSTSGGNWAAISGTATNSSTDIIASITYFTT